MGRGCQKINIFVLYNMWTTPYATDQKQPSGSMDAYAQCRIKVGAIDAAALGPFVK